MRPRIIIAAAAVAIAFSAAPEQARADHKGKVPWVTNPDQGFAQARNSGKPTMVFFTASW